MPAKRTNLGGLDVYLCDPRDVRELNSAGRAKMIGYYRKEMNNVFRIVFVKPVTRRITREDVVRIHEWVNGQLHQHTENEPSNSCYFPDEGADV